MGYGILGSMGYGFKFPAYQLGGSEILWVMGEYGLSELWVMRESTVPHYVIDLQTVRHVQLHIDNGYTIPDGHLVSGGARPTFRQSQNVTDLSESASNYFGTPSTPGHRLANVGSIEFPNYLLNTLE
jgi:hypothetical protein